jgi:hypothetical protein
MTARLECRRNATPLSAIKHEKSWICRHLLN